MNITEMMNKGVANIGKTLGRYYLKNPKGRAFMTRALPRLQRASRTRADFAERGRQIPSFLIASIASRCNLQCSGCYARASGACGNASAASDLSAAEWQSIFKEAMGLGISFVLLAGGEPFMRKDVIRMAADTDGLIFPIFTNGTMLDEESLSLLDENRHLIPVFSIEGGAEETDARRGTGVCAQVYEAMDRLADRKILYGASITVNSENIAAVTEEGFVQDLRRRGCGLLIYVEYVPMDAATAHLALNGKQADELAEALSAHKKRMEDMIILSFPGDEAAMGGCLASGRGFFHVNATGGAEPCPFSPYAKQNLKTDSILDVLDSEYFAALREVALNAGVHVGGCTLFVQNDKVQALQ